MKKRYFLLIFNVLLSIVALSQINQETKLEFEIKPGFRIGYVQSLENEKFLIYQRKKEKKETVRQIGVYDKHFDKIYDFTLISDKTYNRTFTCHSEHDYVMLNWHYKKGDYKFTRVKYATGRKEIYHGSFGKKFTITEMFDIGEYIHLIGYHKKSDFLTYLVFNKNTWEQKTVSFFKESADYLDLSYELDEEKQLVYYNYTESIRRRRNDIAMFSILKANGEITDYHNVVVSDNLDHRLISTKINSIEDGSVFISGSYSKGNATYALGVFLIKMNGEERVFAQYYPFDEFNNFNTYLSDTKKAQLERKKSRKERKGKEFEIYTRIVLHDLNEENGIYYQVGECFYPTYRTESRTEVYYETINVGGKQERVRRERIVYEQVFDGYQYSHAIVVAYDHLGNKLWDNTFEMWLMKKPMNVKRFLTVNVHDDIVDCMFANGYAIKCMSFIDGKVLNDSQVVYVGEDGNEDQIKKTEVIKYTNADVDHWYNRNYLIHGYQVIKDKNEVVGKRKRRVFFVQKVTYSEEYEEKGKPFMGKKKASDIF